MTQQYKNNLQINYFALKYGLPEGWMWARTVRLRYQPVEGTSDRGKPTCSPQYGSGYLLHAHMQRWCDKECEGICASLHPCSFLCPSCCSTTNRWHQWRLSCTALQYGLYSHVLGVTTDRVMITKRIYRTL
jgi:hypothetical protein